MKSEKVGVIDKVLYCCEILTCQAKLFEAEDLLVLVVDQHPVEEEHQVSRRALQAG